MPRDYSRADRELAEQIQVSPRQIERWRDEGCLRSPAQSHPSGVPGSSSAHPPDATDQADAVRALLEAGPLLFPGPKTSFDEVRIRLWWSGRFVEIEHLRASYLALLGLLDPSVRGYKNVAHAKQLANAIVGRASRPQSLRLWIEALKLANKHGGRSCADAAEQIRLGLAVMFTLLQGGSPSDDDVIDTIDNLGFDLDDTLTAHDLAFLDLDAVRAAVTHAGSAEIEQGRDCLRAVLRYAETLSYLGSRLDRSLQWPALSLVVKRVLTANPGQLSTAVPCMIAIRRQFLAIDAGWDKTFDRRLRRAEAQASCLLAVPKHLHRFMMPSARTRRRPSPKQWQALMDAVGAWAARHPDLAELIGSGDQM
ncbi:hypothetical protein GCM10010211_10440 [Streptomyces albospinus]|uniref:Uncharacterized protein n=2 Tax=Streptomyces albospinus TaxID=285515 RepID=A0ABQ2UQ12_9ACTN|nr:hypothetical protein GCM10010211_10440 [Streptomyces albospinus]